MRVEKVDCTEKRFIDGAQQVTFGIPIDAFLE